MNTFGRKFRVSIFGESHGEFIGVVMDGVPAGLELSEQDFEHDILRRKSGAKGTTPRIEEDRPMVVSGVYEGHTTGAPLTVMFHNGNTRSGDYSLFEAMPRPGHADLTAALKWDNCQDPRGGGHFSGRLTLPVVAAGVVAKKILDDATLLDDTPFTGVDARIVELGGIVSEHSRGASLPEAWQEAIDKAIEEGDSLGAVVECTVPDIDPGYGEPFWDSVESQIAHAVFAIPGVRGIEFGDGFAASRMKGSQHNDPIGPDGRPTKNGAGGANGGITNGMPIVFRTVIKPTPSIAKKQKTIDISTGCDAEIEIVGRHDPCIVQRAVPVIEAATAIAIYDLIKGA